jgi:SAM-dependent methyltransferase
VITRSRESCPRCMHVLLSTPDGHSCACCGLWSTATERLWLASEDVSPMGFDQEAVARLEELGEQDHFWMRERRHLIDRLLGRMADASGQPWDSALELGCGAGLMLPLLEARARHVVAMDGHRALLERAYAASGRAVLLQGQVTNTLLTGDRFDLIAAFDVLEHVGADAFLAEARRLARRQGSLLISVPAFPFLWSGMDTRAGHRCRYRWSQLKDELERNGWQPMGHTHFQFLLFPLVTISRRLGKRLPKALERRPPRSLDRLLGAVNRMEVNLLGGATLPFGSSLFAWARAE